MATPMEYYRSLPPVAKTYAVICIMTSGAYHLNLYSPRTISIRYSEVFRHFEIWRLITNFFFIAPYSLTFGIRLLIILRNGVSLERGPFDKRTADYLWMFIFGAFSLLVMAAIPVLWTPFLGPSLIFMIVYVWGREFPNDRVNIHGLVELKTKAGSKGTFAFHYFGFWVFMEYVWAFQGFYLPWYMLGADLILGNPLKPDMLGIVAGHLFYFLTVLYPLSGGKNYCKTPFWVHKLVAFWGEGFQANSPVRKDTSEGVAFSGRSFRLNGGSRAASSRQDPVQNNTAPGGAFSGRSHRLNGR